MGADVGSDEPGITHWQFDTDYDDPAIEVAEVVAELEGVESTELSALYDCVNEILEHLYSNPPSPAAQIQISFTYEGYRITLNQDGSATFLKVR